MPEGSLQNSTIVGGCDADLRGVVNLGPAVGVNSGGGLRSHGVAQHAVELARADPARATA